MTESSPVLTVTRPGDESIPGSVGRPLPGIDVRIDQPDASGVGEIIAKGPNVMSGYFENPEATAATIRTAGCTPATSAGSTRTATCTSSAARRR
jgi:long-chain acyl-CoA synthetase